MSRSTEPADASRLAETAEVEEPARQPREPRERLGSRSPAQVSDTRARIIGPNNLRKPILEVAAFNSFVG